MKGNIPVRIEPFQLERWMTKYEVNVKWDIAESGFWEMYQHGSGMIAVIREFFVAKGITDEEEIFSDDQLRDFISANAVVMAVQKTFLDGFTPEARDKH